MPNARLRSGLRPLRDAWATRSVACASKERIIEAVIRGSFRRSCDRSPKAPRRTPSCSWTEPPSSPSSPPPAWRWSRCPSSWPGTLRAESPSSCRRPSWPSASRPCSTPGETSPRPARSCGRRASSACCADSMPCSTACSSSKPPPRNQATPLPPRRTRPPRTGRGPYRHPDSGPPSPGAWCSSPGWNSCLASVPKSSPPPISTRSSAASAATVRSGPPSAPTWVRPAAVAATICSTVSPWPWPRRSPSPSHACCLPRMRARIGTERSASPGHVRCRWRRHWSAAQGCGSCSRDSTRRSRGRWPSPGTNGGSRPPCGRCPCRWPWRSAA